LSLVSKNTENVVIVDDKPISYLYFPGNLIFFLYKLQIMGCMYNPGLEKKKIIN